ncbi:MAG: hypothetical protein ABIN25_04390 [Ginsengibacter sp.]
MDDPQTNSSHVIMPGMLPNTSFKIKCRPFGADLLMQFILIATNMPSIQGGALDCEEDYFKHLY